MTTKTARKKKVEPRQIAILGYAEETRDKIHGLDESVEVWGINMAHVFTHKSDSTGSITKNLKATNCPEADQYVRKAYRKGWEIKA